MPIAHRRDRMAIAAAPFVHGRPTDIQPGKKELANKRAQTAHEGSDWSDLIQ